MSEITISRNILEKTEDVHKFWDSQMPLNLCEECGELITAVSKMERIFSVYNNTLTKEMFEPTDWENLDIRHSAALTKPKQSVIDEMGDVIISILALCARYDIDINDIEKRIHFKLSMKK